MTKLHRKKKAVASFLAGMFLLQGAFTGGITLKADAKEAAQKIKFEVVGEGNVTVTDVNDKVKKVASEEVFEVPEGMCVRVSADAPEETSITMQVMDVQGKYELEDRTSVNGREFWRDITAMGIEKKVVITFGEEPVAVERNRRSKRQAGNSEEKPEVGNVFTGKCVIEAVDGGNGHTVHGVTIGGFTGILAGTTAFGGCADHTAAAPYVGQEYTYRYTVTGVNKSTGEVTGNLYCTSVTGATDGVTKDANGRLIGYQRISGSALIHRSYSGFARLTKGKTETTLTDGNICYSLAGAVYGVYKDEQTTQEIAEFITDADGNANTIETEEGQYYVKEKKAPSGYKLDRQVYPVQVRSGQTTEVHVKDIPLYVTTGFEIEKLDQEKGYGDPLGAGSLEGAEFTVRYYAGEYIKENLPDEAEKTWVLKTKKEEVEENGQKKERYVAKLEDSYKVSGDEFYLSEGAGKPVLPLGTLTIEETKAPEGYIRSSELQVTAIRQDGDRAQITNGQVYKAMNQIIRGDIEFKKKDEESQASMAGIPFEITSMTTGESHRIMTDANGYYSSESAYVKHSENTNTGQPETGLWFGRNSGGKTLEVNDSYGALPYDTYELKEVRCEKNRDKSLYKGTFKITKDQYVVDLGTIMNPDLMISTVAKDEKTGTHYSKADKSATIIDTVSYTGLKKGKEYTMKGILMDRKTGESIKDGEGKEITAVRRFKPKTAEGNVEVEFTFDGSTLQGKDITVFEECYIENDLIAVHKDLEDKNQMIHFPALQTEAKDQKTGQNVTKAEKNIVILDTVQYKNLKEGKKYKVTGTLIDKKTGEKIKDAKGDAVTSTVEFVAETSDGTVEVEFRFDGRKLGGKTMVAFEKLYYGEKLYAVHEDLEDEKQTIYIPKIDTTAVNTKTKSKLAYAEENVTVTDVVKYENLQPGETYTLHGTIIEKKSLKELTEEKAIEFIPEKKNGTIEMTFELNGSEMQGKTIVVYEELKQKGKSVAVHKDPESKEQSIYFPKIGTKAVDAESRTQEGVAKAKQKITDQVSYENLVPGEVYVLKGVLMSKEEGKELTDKNGKSITSSITFTPEKENGTVDMTFELDASELDGKSVVVFEKVYDKAENLIAREENISNQEQTVIYKRVKEPKGEDSKKSSGETKISKTPKTGDVDVRKLCAVSVISLGILMIVGIITRRRKKN